MKKIILEDIESKLNIFGYTLVDRNYINSDQKLTLKDDLGYYYTSIFRNINKGQHPNKFDKSNSYTIQNIELWCKLNNKPFELVEGQKYEGNKKYLQWRCLKKDCGEIFDMTWSNILSNHGCSICKGKQTGLSNCLATKNPDLAAEWHHTLNGDLTPYDVTVNSGKYVWWLCSKNPKHIWYSKISDRNSKNNGCPYCSGKLPSEDYNLLVCNPRLCEEWDYNKNKKRPEEYCPNSNDYAWWKCRECGYEWRARIQSRYNGTNCSECSESKGEIKIREYLKEHNIEYIPQKEFNELIGLGGGLLSYDFYLPYYNLLIEYQGEQHKSYIKGFHKSKKDFIKQQEHDKRKREYANKNNINLLEIWYWDFDNIENILINKIKIGGDYYT